ncbi:MAG: radical SAM protein [Caulobacteraceae bacterium]
MSVDAQTRHIGAGKFSDPDLTAKGEARAVVAFDSLKTLWVNTGTLCNITCANCYIESSPTNDRLSYFTPADLAPFLAEAEALSPEPIEVGFTGGEPFMNPHMGDLAEMVLARGHLVLILTNAMRPMMRPKPRAALLGLRQAYASRLALRVSLDHYSADRHDEERGPGGFEETIDGIAWLIANGFGISLAGRTLWHESEAQARAGYARLSAAQGWGINAYDPAKLMLFPEMDESVDVPEISEKCWDILNVDPRAMMCASARMLVKRAGAAAPAVLACTLLPYDQGFELGPTLKGAVAPVKLNHRHCAKFCVLGGGSCSA